MFTSNLPCLLYSEAFFTIICKSVKVSLHVMLPSMFNIASMVMDTLTSTIGCAPIQPIKVSNKKIKGVTHKNVDIDSTCKRSPNVYSRFFQNRCHVNGMNSSAVTTDVSEPRSTAMERMTVGINLMNHQLVVRYDPLSLLFAERNEKDIRQIFWSQERFVNNLIGRSLESP